MTETPVPEQLKKSDAKLAVKTTKSSPRESTLLRWCKIKWLSFPTIEALHEREREVYRRAERLAQAGRPVGEANDWLLVFSRFLTERGYYGKAFNGFWPKGMTDAEKKLSVEEFHRRIFPVWRPIWDRFDASWNKEPGKEGFLSEIDCIHECDFAIKRDGYEFPPKDAPKKAKRTEEFSDLMEASGKDAAAGF